MNFNLYELGEKKIFSLIEYKELPKSNSKSFFKNSETIYYLGKMPLGNSRASFSLSDPSLLFIEEENFDLLKKPIEKHKLPDYIMKKIHDKHVMYINTSYPNWKTLLDKPSFKKWRINILALGDVGSTLLIGLKLLGGIHIEKIGIFDKSKENMERLEIEMNQISLPFNNNLPQIEILKYDDLFNCDMFVFCASKGVPPVGTSVTDVRMFQFEENSKIIAEYAKLARKNKYRGFFAVVSDPVDQLCYVALKESNINVNGVIDYDGLYPEQIKGYGLGVMNARALYYSKKIDSMSHFENEGRAFGPHGNDLVIADSISNYNNKLSLELTELAINANYRIRDLGFKPYIAPALSSGAISIIKTISEEWHYSSNFIGGAFMGSKNKLNSTGVELERITMHEDLERRLQLTYSKLRDFNER